MGGTGGGQGGGHPFGADFGASMSDMFEELLGRGRSQSGGRGGDLRYDITLDLETAYRGEEQEISLRAPVACEMCSGSGGRAGAGPERCGQCGGTGAVRMRQGFFTLERACPACRGAGELISDPCLECRGAGVRSGSKTLRVRIPAGVEDGTRLRLSGKGGAARRGGLSGDLYIFLRVAQHEIFDREGMDLFCEMPLAFTIAALGGEMTAPTLGGGRVKVKVPEGSQSGRRLRLRGKGMPSMRGGEKGDLFITLLVETPVRLSGEQKSLLRRFEKSLGPGQCAAKRGFFHADEAFF